jgi:anti-sigma B factor antagonist
MSDIKISLDTSGPRGEVSVVRVDGVIDTMTSSDLEKVMNSLLERGRYNIIIDLGGVDYISSAGWGIFISNIREIRQHSGDIKLARMIPNVYEIFELLEFDSILKAYENVEKAKIDFLNIKKIAAQEQAGKPVQVMENLSSRNESKPAPAGIIESQSASSLTAADKPRPPLPPLEPKPAPKTIDEVVFEIMLKDPFLSISEIKEEIIRKYPALKPGWWKIWSILRRNGMLSKKNRFRKSRHKSGDFN